MNIEDLTKEQIEQFRTYESYDEFKAYADEIGIELDESNAEVLRMAFNDTESLAAHGEMADVEGDEVDITMEELKVVAGGDASEDGLWVPILNTIHPAYTRNIIMETARKYGIAQL